MKVFELQSDSDKYWSLFTDFKTNEELTNSFKGDAISKNWQVKTFEWDDGKDDPPGYPNPDSGKGDIATCSSRLVAFNENAKEMIGSILNDCGELLEIKIKNEENKYYIFNATIIIDALDHKMTEIKYFPTNPTKIMRIKKYFFHKKKLKDIYIFKLPEKINDRAYVTDKFKDKVEESGLKGFYFKQLWEG